MDTTSSENAVTKPPPDVPAELWDEIEAWDRASSRALAVVEAAALQPDLEGAETSPPGPLSEAERGSKHGEPPA